MSLREEIASLLNDARSSPADGFETILDHVEDHPARDVEIALESLVDDDRDVIDAFPDMLAEFDVDPYLSDGTDAQRVLIATIQRLVAKHSPNRRNELIPVLVDGLRDPARREQVSRALAEICSYNHTIAGDTIEELERAPATLYSNPAAVDAITDVVSSIEESHHRYRGEVELPAVARLQIGTEREQAKQELVERVERSESDAREIIESVDQLLATVDDDGPESRRSRQAAREILFEAAISSPEIVVPYAERLALARELDGETVINAYARLLDADVDAAEDLFASVVAEAAEHRASHHRVEAVASLLPGAPDSIIAAILEEVREGALDPPPVQEESREELHDDSRYLLALLWTDETAPIGKQFVAMELEGGETRLAADIATVIRGSPHGHLAERISEVLDNADDLPCEIVDVLAAGIVAYFHRDNASAEVAGKLAAPAPKLGGEVLDRLIGELDREDCEPTVNGDTFRDFVEHVVEISAEPVATRSGPLLDYAVDSNVTTGILTSLGDALERAPVSIVEDSASVLDAAVALIDAEDEEVVVHGCRLVAHLEPYPVPDELLALATDAQGVVEQRAEWAIDYIDDASRNLKRDLFEVPDDKPAVRHLAKQGIVKYRSSTTWDDLRIGPLEMDILHSITTHYSRDLSALVTHPAHDPRITLLYAIALLCEGADDGEPAKIGIASPVYGHKGRWGTFGDIEEEYQKYGISDHEGTTIRAVTFDDLFGTSRVKEGQISIENRGSKAGTLVLTKSVDNLSQIADELTGVVIQAVERFKIPLSELANRINEDFGDTPVFPIYSATTKLDTGGVPDISPPSNLEDADVDVVSTETSLSKIGEKFTDVNAIRRASKSITDGDTGGSIDQLDPPIRGALEAAGYTWSKELTIRAVGSESLRESIDEALNIGFDLDMGGSKLLNTVFRFERLPVNASDFDTWVEEEVVVNPWSRVDTFGDQLDDIEDSTNRDHITSSTTIAIRDAIRALDKVNDQVQDANPLFERLLSRLEETVGHSERVGIVVARTAFVDVLSDVLAEELDASIGQDVVILTPEDVSSAFALDILFVVGPQRPSHAAVYFPSCTSRIEVLTIGTFWENYIEKHASRYRRELAEALAVDSDYLGELSVTTEDETKAVEEPEPRQLPTASGAQAASDSPNDDSGPAEPTTHSSEATGVAGGGDSGASTWLPDSLNEAFERAAEVEGEHGEDGGYGSSPTYEVRTEQEERLQLGRGEAIYEIETSPGGGQSYSWTAPSEIESGDEILILEPEFISPRRDEWLQRQYEQQFDDPEAVLEGLYKWWTAMNEVLQELDSEMDSRSSVVRAFYRAVKANGVEKTKTTVRLWIKAIEESDSPIGLATVSEGTKGPDQAGDIEAIGKAFDDPRLEEDAEAIERALDDVREFNAIGGRQYRKVIETRLKEGHPAFRDAATPHVAVEIRKLDQGN